MAGRHLMAIWKPGLKIKRQDLQFKYFIYKISIKMNVYQTLYQSLNEALKEIS